MLVARELVMLGIVEFLEVEDSHQEVKRLVFPKAEPWGLLCNDSGTAIYLLPQKGAQIRDVPKNQTTRRRGRALFKRWHSFLPDNLIAFTVPDSAVELHKIGTAVAIQYISDKWTGKLISYIHDFTRAPVVYADRAKNIRAVGILATNGKTLCTPRGIVG